MTNKQIANTFDALADIMELHQENPFKIKSYRSAYINLRKLEQPLAEMKNEDIAKIQGVGKAIGEKIQELLATGKLDTYQKYAEKTPNGIIELLKINGIGPKKIYTIWKELEIKSVGELLYACNENRLIELKGFGEKTQTDLIKKLEYFQKSNNKFHYATVEEEAIFMVEQFKKRFPSTYLVGEMRRKNPIVKYIEILIATDNENLQLVDNEEITIIKNDKNLIEGITKNEFPIKIHFCKTNEVGSKIFKLSGAPIFINSFLAKANASDFKNILTEKAVFEHAQIEYIEPELRENEISDFSFTKNLIEEADIKGILHLHTTYSDGIHSLKTMAAYIENCGFEYMLVTDHSKSAFYAQGLKTEKVLQQIEEIEVLNAHFDNNFKIFKGIESDILNDGSLDYEEDILKKFDCIIASIHSNLNMSEENANARLIKAIENPYTKILGHPTGRLLLSREGYPIDHKKIIDACAANRVAIELNANPYRLDLDWTWIPYALQKGVFIAINPDAHSKEAIHNIKFGVFAGRKGALTKDMCLNVKNKAAFQSWLECK